MKLKTNSFCSLSRNQDWQNWLKQTDLKLYDGLIATITTKKSCRANSNKMMDIYYELYQNNKGHKLEEFIESRFPWLIEHQEKSARSEIRQKAKTIKTTAKQPKETNYDELNKHKVFANYKPHILSFPQKLIFFNEDSNHLHHKVQEFTKDKLGVDYIIIENHAYVEYFDPKYSNVVDRVLDHTRDIYKYRQKQRQHTNSGPSDPLY